MIIRVFVPRSHDAPDGLAFSGSDHNFPVIPNVGHVLRFTDERNGDDFTVSKAGFVQNGDAFIAAVWLEGPGTDLRELESRPGPQDRPEYRDLNYDVPPESMTGY